MPQSLYRLHVHIVFSTKRREPCLATAVLPALHAYLAGILRNLECTGVTVGGVSDHVHIVCNLTKKHAPMKVLEIVKKDSSKWLKTQSPALTSFHWQDGYGLFSLSPAHVTAAREYVLNQEEHHRKETFKEELLRLLNTYGMDYDERFLWD